MSGSWRAHVGAVCGMTSWSASNKSARGRSHDHLEVIPKTHKYLGPPWIRFETPCCGTIGTLGKHQLIRSLLSHPLSLSLSDRLLQEIFPRSSELYERVAANREQWTKVSHKFTIRGLPSNNSLDFLDEEYELMQAQGAFGDSGHRMNGCLDDECSKTDQWITRSAAFAFREKVDVTPSSPSSPRQRCSRANRLGYG